MGWSMLLSLPPRGRGGVNLMTAKGITLSIHLLHTYLKQLVLTGRPEVGAAEVS